MSRLNLVLLLIVVLTSLTHARTVYYIKMKPNGSSSPTNLSATVPTQMRAAKRAVILPQNHKKSTFFRTPTGPTKPCRCVPTKPTKPPTKPLGFKVHYIRPASEAWVRIRTVFITSYIVGFTSVIKNLLY